MSIKIQFTPHQIAELIAEQSGKDVSQETHWIKVSVECTRELAPYSLITLEAIER